MSNILSLNAKIAGLRKGIFTEDDYKHIMSLIHKKDLLTYLSTNPLYQGIFDEFEDVQSHLESDFFITHVGRYGFEHMIVKSEIKILSKLKFYSSKELKDLISSFILRYEAEDLKLYLSSVNSEEKINPDVQIYTSENSKYLDHEKIIKAKNKKEIMDTLVGTPFLRLLSTVADEEEYKSHFHVQMLLDNLYFREIEKSSSKFSTEDRNIIQNYFFSIADIYNIQWILRAKKYYGLSNEEIYNYSIKVGKVVKGELLKKLVYANSAKELMELLHGTKYEDIVNQAKSISQLYRNQRKNLLSDVDSKHLNYQANISTLVRFIADLENQNKNIIMISQAQKYSKANTAFLKDLLIIV